MGILSGIFKSRDKPQNATSGSAYRFFIGGSSSGKNVNERSAMQMTAVYSCVRILSEAVASLPLHVYKYNGDGGKEKAVKHPLYFLLHDEPNPEMTSFVFRETLMTHLLLWGNAYAQIIRNGKGEIIALYPLMPNRMTVDRDEKGQLYYQYNTSKDDAPTMKGSMVNLKPSDVLHIPGLGFDGLVGYSPIAMAKNAIGMAIACEEYGAKFFANGATPGGILENPRTVKDPQRVRESWTSAFGGSSNANKELAGVVVNNSVTREVVSKEQMRKFLKFVHDDNVYCKYYEVVYILFHTGMRISEFCGLTLKDLDMKNRIINIDHQLLRTSEMKYVVETTKTNAGTRKLPMTEDVFRCFQAIIEDRERPKIEKVVDGHVVLCQEKVQIKRELFS